MTATVVGIGLALLAAILGTWRDIKGDLTAMRFELHGVGECVARIEGRLDERDRHHRPA